MVNKPYYMYVLHCADDSLYCGFTDDVKHRVSQHQHFKGAKYTKVKARHPLTLIYWQEFASKHDALSAEYHFKHQSRKQKEQYLQKHGVSLKHSRDRKSVV